MGRMTDPLSNSGRSGGPTRMTEVIGVGCLSLVELELVERRPPRIRGRLGLGRTITGHERREAVGLRPAAVVAAQRSDGKGQQHRLSHHRFQIDVVVGDGPGLALGGAQLEYLAYGQVDLTGHRL